MEVTLALLVVGVKLNRTRCCVFTFFFPQLNGFLMASSEPFYMGSSDVFLPF